ncbi:MAG: trigger factor [Solirubrobacteraceae bacterium]|nr:trigger factor [Solirubrobacteraceae bacterium]
MPTAVTTTVTELPESRVNVDVEVAADEIQRSLESQARKLGREMKIPGFRTGKIPPAVVIQRVGREPILDEAVRGRLTDWYMEAVDESGIAPVGDPDVDLDLAKLPGEGKPLTFSFEVGVRPSATLGAYRGLKVVRREAIADPEAVEDQVDEMRERFARLEIVDRPAETGDFVTLDFVGTIDGEPFEGGEGRDQLVEVGAGRLIPGFEEGLIGVRAGEERTVDATFPEDYAAKHVAGKPAQFAFSVKEVKHKDLPAADDDFASDAAGYDTIEELRASIAEELLEHDVKRVEAEFRAGALDAVVGEATVDVPEPLVTARAKELLDRMLHSLGHQGITKEAYLKITGKTEEELAEESRPDAEIALRREAVLAAVIEAERIEPTDAELLDALEDAATREQTSRQKLLDRLRQAGRVDMLIREVAAEQAIDLVVTTAVPIAPDEADEKPAKAAETPAKKAPAAKKPAAKKPAAKKKAPAKQQGDKAAAGGELWTPEQEAAGAKDKLWTPDT